MTDIMYILMFLIPAIAQIYVSSTYKKYKAKAITSKLTGYDVARKILDSNGLNALYIVETKGTMSDHYDPKRKTIRLSADVYHGDSIAALAIAAHECGHAIQDKEGYFFLKVRSFIYPVVNVATKMSYIILLLGVILEFFDLILAGILLVGFGLVFQIITLPVEFNASNRAVDEINKLGIANNEDHNGIKKMLKSAALTYVAGVLASALEVLRLLMIFTSRKD